MSDVSPSAFDWKRGRVVHRGNLPHVREENVIYFVTFHLADSLPAVRVAELRDDRNRWLGVNPQPHTPQQQHEYRRLWTVRVENLLDAGYGACPLRDHECRAILEGSLRHGDGGNYQLGEFVIMPNHVHVMVHMLPGRELSDTVKAWKSVSARRIGKRLVRTGSYWRDEYFDHAVRGDDSLLKFARYIQDNPRRLPPGTFTLGKGTLRS